MIYVFCHIGAKKPNGGVKILFEYAQALIRNGYNAAILIPGAHLYPNDCPNGYKPDWFDLDVSVPVFDDVRVVTENDVVVIHEEGIWCYEHLSKNNPQMIMINQGLTSSLTDNVGMHISYKFARDIYSKCLGVITISPYISDGVEDIFGVSHDKIHMIENPIDDFFSVKPTPKDNTILVMNKQPGNVVSQMLIKIISERYEGWDIKLIQNMTLKQVADEMTKAKIFVFLCTPHGEGSSLPPVEAALSGCHVFGYSGLGSRYYYKYPIFTEIEYNDVAGFVRKLDRRIDEINRNGLYIDMQSIDKLKQRRHKDVFVKRVGDVFKELLGG